MKNQRTFRRRITGSQIIGLLLMLAGFSIIFATGISASKHREHIFSAEESEYMEQAETDEEKDLLEKWTYTKDQTRKAAALPLLILSGFLIVAGAPLFYTPIAVEAHKSRMSRKEDAEKRRNLNRSARTSRKLDRELKKAQEEAERQAEQFRLEEKKKWERARMKGTVCDISRDTETPMQEVYFNDTPEFSAEPGVGSTEAEALIRKQMAKQFHKRHRRTRPSAPYVSKNPPAEKKPWIPDPPPKKKPSAPVVIPEGTIIVEHDQFEENARESMRFFEEYFRDHPEVVKQWQEKKKKEQEEAAEAAVPAGTKEECSEGFRQFRESAPELLKRMEQLPETRSAEKKNEREVREYFDKYDKKKAPAAPGLEQKDLAYLNVMTVAKAEAEQHYENLRKKQAENWNSSGVMEDAAAEKETPVQENKPAPVQENKPKPAGRKKNTGKGKKKKNSRKKGGKRRKHLLF